MADDTTQAALAALNARLEAGKAVDGEYLFSRIARLAMATDAQQQYMYQTLTLQPQDARDLLAFFAVQGIIVRAVEVGTSDTLRDTPPEKPKAVFECIEGKSGYAWLVRYTWSNDGLRDSKDFYRLADAKEYARREFDVSGSWHREQFDGEYMREWRYTDANPRVRGAESD